MFDKFSDRAKKVIGLSQRIAERYRQDSIATEHLLLALFEENTGVAVTALKNLGLDTAPVRREIEKLSVVGKAGKPVPLPFVPDVKKALEQSSAEARKLGHPYIGTEHLLLGLLAQRDSIAARVLINLGLTLEGVRNELLGILGDAPAAMAGMDVQEHPKPTFLMEKAWEVAFEEAARLGHSEAAPDHLLLGLLLSGDNLATEMAAELGLTIEQARERVRARHDSPPGG